MRGVGKDVVAIEVLGFGNATHPGEQALHVIVMAIRRDDLVLVARTIPDLVHDPGFCSRQASCGIRGSAWLTTDRIVGVIMAPSRLLDHAIDDAVDSIACRQSPLIDVLELGRVEPVLAELLM